MKAYFQMLALIALAAIICPRAGAQGIGLLVKASSNPVVVSNSLTFTITVTNQVGVTLTNVSVTNAFSPNVQFNSTNTNQVIVSFGDLTNNASIQKTLTVRPLTIGFLTNSVVVGSTSTNILVSTNVIVAIINSNSVVTDLGVGIVGFSTNIFVNDQVTYFVGVTNFGPNTVTNVVLSNGLPAGVKLIGVSPTNQAYTFTNSFVVMNLSKLTNGTSKKFQLTIQPTNSGVMLISASVSSTNIFDTNSANDLASTNITVSDFLAGTSNLVAFTNSAQIFNRQTGREQQIVTLSNAGPTSVAAARVIVSGLTNWLFNAVGTNDGNPFVVHAAPLGAGQSVNLTFQYYPNRTNFSFDNSQLHPVEVTPPDLSLPATGITSTNINIIAVSNLVSGYILVEFSAITNRTYTVAYKDDLASTNWLAAQPSFHSSANYYLWIDYGPPETLSNSPARSYRVYMNP